MRSDTQLEYAIFQLTPTRTRCELHVAAKGSTYKLASGLLKPFLSHLRAAEEQLAKGGYSIRLEPPDPSTASWFTKGTMERFVRFVSTPEVLERVSSVEVELLELEETTRQQTADDNDSNEAGQNETTASKAPPQLSSGGKPITFAASEKATKASSEGVENGVEESTKQRLLRALDARRMMLQKEQGMAFARALAAGFNLENMDDLVLFAEFFGANRLREACMNFLALCKKRQEAGLGLEDLELMAAENAQAEMALLGAMSGSPMGLSWPPHGNGHDQLQSSKVPIEGKLPGGDDGRRGSLDEASRDYWQSGPSLRPTNGSAVIEDGEGGPGIVNGNSMMTAWQGHPHNQHMPGAHPYGAMHPGMLNHYDPTYGFVGPARSGQPGLQYPHYLGGPYIPALYPDSNGWQAHSGVPPPYWPGNQAHDPADGAPPQPPQQPSKTTLSTREKNGLESAKFASDDGYDEREELPNEPEAHRTRRPARRSASPRRQSPSPMRRVKIGRSAGSKRSGMVVIRNINYIAPKSQQHDNKDVDDSENSESWREDGESDEGLTNTAETLRASIEGAVEGKYRATKDPKRKQSKKEKEASPKTVMCNVDDAAEPEDNGHEKTMSRPTDDAWMLGKAEIASNGSRDLVSDEALFTINRVREQGSYDPGLESGPVVKESRENGKDCQLAEDAMVMSERDGHVRPSPSLSVNLFEQEHQEREESRNMTVMDESYIFAVTRSAPAEKITTNIRPDVDFSSTITEHSQAEKTLSDDSFLLLDRSATREGASGEWRRPLNLESEMPSDQNLDVADHVPPESFEPNDLCLIPERSQDTYKRAWNTPLDYDMHVLAADMMGNGHESHDKQEEEEDADALVEPEGLEEQIEHQPMESNSKKLSEKDAKAKAMKEMLEKRKSQVGTRPGRFNSSAEAQLRAEKLRLYKAGLQKSKKEKEEEERKRIEELRSQRQQRIAARSNPNGSPSSPSLARAVKTTPLTVSKPSPKAPNRLSNGSSLSPSLSRDRVPIGNRVVRQSLDSPKLGENKGRHSVSPVTELHRETNKATLAVRASTGSQLPRTLRSDGVPVARPQLKINAGTEDKLGMPKSGHADNKVGHTDSRLVEERFRRTGARPDEKLGCWTESGRENRISQRESGCMPEKVQTLKTVKKVAPQAVPPVAVKPAKSSSTDSKPVKRVLTVSSKSPAQMRNAVVPPRVTVEEIVVEQKALPLAQKGEPKVKSPVKLAEHGNLGPVLVSNGTSDEVGNDCENISSKKDVNAQIDAKLPVETAAEGSISHAEKIGNENGSFIPKATVTMPEGLNEDALLTGSPLHTESVAGSDDRELEVEADSSVGEDYHAPIAHVSPPENNPKSFPEADLCASVVQTTEHNTLPLAPPSEFPWSPSANFPHLSPSMQQTESATETNAFDTPVTRSRKKWGDSKAKGLKRLLLLGRKSSRGSGHTISDIPSECDEEESPSSHGLDGSNEQAGAVSVHSDASPANSSSKGSRSIFSLSTFRGKSVAKA